MQAPGTFRELGDLYQDQDSQYLNKALRGCTRAQRSFKGALWSFLLNKQKLYSLCESLRSDKHVECTFLLLKVILKWHS